MSFINKRLFGAPMPDKVIEKLNDRQSAASEGIKPNSLTTNFLNKDHKTIADLSSRTAAIRMWTAVSMINKEITEMIYEERDVLTADDDEKYEALNAQSEYQLEQIQERYYPNAEVVKVGDKFYIRAKEIPRDELKLATKIYTVGNHYLNYEVHPHETILNDKFKNTYKVGSWSEQMEPFVHYDLKSKEWYEEHPEYDAPNPPTIEGALSVFPQTQARNDFMKPPAGIISIQSSTEGAIGAVKRTTINFVVHNFHDFDRIYSRFF